MDPILQEQFQSLPKNNTFCEQLKSISIRSIKKQPLQKKSICTWDETWDDQSYIDHCNEINDWIYDKNNRNVFKRIIFKPSVSYSNISDTNKEFRDSFKSIHYLLNFFMYVNKLGNIGRNIIYTEYNVSIEFIKL